MRRRSITAAAALVLLAAAWQIALTDEGQWTPDQLDQLGLERAGLELSVDEVFNPGGEGIHEAVLLLGGGTGEFVSPEGLIMTNHHVAFGAVARIATAEQDYITDGYYASSPADEIPARGYTARMVEYYRDVTGEVLRDVSPGMDPGAREAAIAAARQRVLEAARSERPDLQFTLSAFSYGNAYKITGYLTIPDVRIVYVPPFAVGNFGADTDNWMFPRHTGDFSFLRAYVAPDGSPVPYSTENVPYHPRSWLRMAERGPQEGDFVFLMGFPGSTMRYTDSCYLAYERESRLPYEIMIRGERIDVMQEMSEGDRELEIRFAQTIKGIANGYKNYQGKVVGIDRRQMVRARREREAAWMEWLQDHPDRALYDGVLAELEGVYAARRERDPIERTVSELLYSDVQSYAFGVLTYLEQMQLPESRRDGRYQGSRGQQTRARLLEGPGDIYLPVDSELYRRAAIRALALPEEQSIAVFEEIVEGKEMQGYAPVLSEAVAEAYAGSDLLSPAGRELLLEMSPSEAAASGDLFLEVAAEIGEDLEQLRRAGAAERQELERLRRLYARGMMDYLRSRGQTLYPDANRTLRFSYGYVKGYYPEDAVHILPFTHMEGVMQKETGEGEFIVPDLLKQAYRRKDFGPWEDASGDVPVNLLTTCDTTGGNSGSPVMNARGELIGINFDRVWEATVNDYGFDPEFGRNISVDMRYILFICRTFGAERVLEELGY